MVVQITAMKGGSYVELLGQTVHSQKLEELYDVFNKMVYWAAYSVLHDRENASDVMQNVFLSAYRHIDTLGTMDEAQCRSWLYRSAVNGSIDFLRRIKRLVPTEDAGMNEVDPSASPQEEANKRETRAAVRQALAGLPEKYQRPLMLYYFADMDYQQIAALMELNEGTLKSRMSRGRALLEKELRKGGGSYE